MGVNSGLYPAPQRQRQRAGETPALRNERAQRCCAPTRGSGNRGRGGAISDVDVMPIVWLVRIGDFRSRGLPGRAPLLRAARPPRRAAPTRRFGKLPPGINLKIEIGK